MTSAALTVSHVPFAAGSASPGPQRTYDSIAAGPPALAQATRRKVPPRRLRSPSTRLRAGIKIGARSASRFDSVELRLPTPRAIRRWEDSSLRGAEVTSRSAALRAAVCRTNVRARIRRTCSFVGIAFPSRVDVAWRGDGALVAGAKPLRRLRVARGRAQAGPRIGGNDMVVFLPRMSATPDPPAAAPRWGDARARVSASPVSSAWLHRDGDPRDRRERERGAAPHSRRLRRVLRGTRRCALHPRAPTSAARSRTRRTPNGFIRFRDFTRAVRAGTSQNILTLTFQFRTLEPSPRTIDASPLRAGLSRFRMQLRRYVHRRRGSSLRRRRPPRPRPARTPPPHHRRRLRPPPPPPPFQSRGQPLLLSRSKFGVAPRPARSQGPPNGWARFAGTSEAGRLVPRTYRNSALYLFCHFDNPVRGYAHLHNSGPRWRDFSPAVSGNVRVRNLPPPARPPRTGPSSPRASSGPPCPPHRAAPPPPPTAPPRHATLRPLRRHAAPPSPARRPVLRPRPRR